MTTTQTQVTVTLDRGGFTTSHEVTVHPIGSGYTSTVTLAGRPIGVVYGTHMAREGRSGSYRFATPEDALTALVSAAVVGSWRGELASR